MSAMAPPQSSAASSRGFPSFERMARGASFARPSAGRESLSSEARTRMTLTYRSRAPPPGLPRRRRARAARRENGIQFARATRGVPYADRLPYTDRRATRRRRRLGWPAPCKRRTTRRRRSPQRPPGRRALP
eukprot:2391726-Prymnesium_polylepis.1